MKKIKIISILLAGILLLTSCSTTMYFQKTWIDPQTKEQVISNDVIEAPPVGIFTRGQREPNLAYKMKWGNLLLGVGLLQTIVVPIVMWGFYLFEADHVKNDCCYIKTEKPIYTPE